MVTPVTAPPAHFGLHLDRLAKSAHKPILPQVL